MESQAQPPTQPDEPMASEETPRQWTAPKLIEILANDAEAGGPGVTDAGVFS